MKALDIDLADLRIHNDDLKFTNMDQQYNPCTQNNTS